MSFGGDGDLSGGRVAGDLRIRRADDEKTAPEPGKLPRLNKHAEVSHYNVYWRRGGQKELIGSVPSIGHLGTSCTGECHLLNMSYKDGVREYKRQAHLGPEAVRWALAFKIGLRLKPASGVKVWQQRAGRDQLQRSRHGEDYPVPHRAPGRKPSSPLPS